jgi:phage protein D
MPSRDNVAPITIKFDGQALDATKANLLVEVVVKKIRFHPDAAHVRLRDPTQTLVDGGTVKLGAAVEISAGGPDDTSTKSLFAGTIVTVEPEFGEQGVIVGFRAYDSAHAMTKTKRLRSFQNQTAGDMIKSVGADYFSDGITVSKDSSPYEYMMQNSESDWDFCWRLAKVAGLEFVAEGKKAYLREAGQGATDAPWLQYGESEAGHRLFSFRPRLTSANVAKTYRSTFIDHKNAKIEVSVDFAGDAVTKNKQAKGFAPKGVGTAKGKGVVSIANVVAKDAKELRKYIESIRDVMVNSAFEADGVAEGNPDLKPGMNVQVKGVGSYSGTFLLSETTHVYRGASGFTTRFVISSRPKMLVDAVDTSNGSSAADPGMQLMRGEVTNLSDPDKIGRVRVKVDALKDEEPPEGWWARIASVASGKDRGLLMMPQVGDTVVLGFENGDTRSPFVLGSMWNGKAPPGKDLVQDDGSFSLMSDSKILMKSKGDITIQGSKEWIQKIAKKVELSNDSTDSFTIKSGKEIVIKAPQIKIQADMKIEMKAPQISISADAKLDLKAGMTTIGGGMVKLG